MHNQVLAAPDLLTVHVASLSLSHTLSQHYHTYQSLLAVKCFSPKRTLVKSEVGAAERAPSAAGDLFEVGHCRDHQSPP